MKRKPRLVWAVTPAIFRVDAAAAKTETDVSLPSWGPSFRRFFRGQIAESGGRFPLTDSPTTIASFFPRMLAGVI